MSKIFPQKTPGLLFKREGRKGSEGKGKIGEGGEHPSK
jgi:hypothetical protein